MIKPQHKRPVHLYTVIVEDARAARIIGRRRRLLPRIQEIPIAERFESNEHTGAAGERHITDEAGIIGDVNRNCRAPDPVKRPQCRSEEHTSELQSPYVISYAVFCLK